MMSFRRFPHIINQLSHYPDITIDFMFSQDDDFVNSTLALAFYLRGVMDPRRVKIFMYDEGGHSHPLEHAFYRPEATRLQLAAWNQQKKLKTHSPHAIIEPDE